MAKKATAAASGQVIGYARVSTDKQDADRQRLDIQAYAEAQGLALARVVVETISSRKAEREVFAVIEAMRSGDTLIVTELSRLARSMIELNGIISKVILKGARLMVCDGQIVDASKESALMVSVLGYAAETERDMISERTKSALRARKAAGMKLGRPAGQGVKVPEAAKKVDMAISDIDRMMEAGASAATVARILGIDARTVLRWKQARKAAAV